MYVKISYIWRKSKTSTSYIIYFENLNYLMIEIGYCPSSSNMSNINNAQLSITAVDSV